MKTTKFEGVDLRQVLYGMISNDIVLTRVASQWREGLFDNDFANQIGEWCVKYVREYQKAPNEEIHRLLERWVDEKSPTDEMVGAVEMFLMSVLDEDDEIETDHLLDIAGKYFNRVRIKREIELAQIDLDTGELKEVKNRLRGLVSVELGEGSFVTPSDDFSVWYQSLEERDERSLVTYPQEVGEFFRGSMLRGEFYSFMAPDKTGKSAWLIDLAWRAIRKKNRVAYFDTGDSDQDEVLRRFAQRISGHPEKKKEISIPKKWENIGSDENPNWDLSHDSETKEAVNPQQAFRALRKRTRSKDAFRLSCHSNSSLSVAELNSILIDWERSGWRPDVVVIDYADIMALPKGSRDTLDQIDDLWKSLRRLTMERHCLLVTATQSNASAYGLGDALLTRRNFSGRKTKLAHVNGMIGINVSSDERATHRARLNWIVRRRWSNRLPPCVHVAGCYDVENPIILSRW